MAAFIAEHTANDPAAAAILAELDEETRLAVAAQARPQPLRCAWLRERTGSAWSPARLAHVEDRAFVALRRALQRRGMWQP